MSRILLVDDEQDVLNALRRELRSEYEVEALASPKDALTRCGDAVFDLVIADYLMPGMNGVQFLKQFREIQPDAARLILSGHADIQGLLRAINETHIYRFVAKPWETVELKSAIAQALKYCRVLQDNRRLAESSGRSSLRPESSGLERRHPYRIALVTGDQAVLRFIRSELAPETGHEAENDALWHEILCDHPTVPTKIELQVDTFVSGVKALDQACFANYDLVIAAQSLPDMSGIQFLGKWAQAQPNAARILMGASIDMTLLSQAINEAQVYCVIDFTRETPEMGADVIKRGIGQVHHLKWSVMEALAARELMLENERMAKEVRQYRW